MMFNVPGYPKICTLGQRPVEHIFNSEVEVTEKLDGSFFAFGVFDGELYCRSKKVQIDVENLSPSDMFFNAVAAVKMRIILIEEQHYENVWFYGEFLRKPKHNTLNYDRTPLSGIALFAMMDPTTNKWAHSWELKSAAVNLEMDVVQQVFFPHLKAQEAPEAILNFLDSDPKSQLGGPMEGVVVKNFNEEMEYVGRYSPFTVAKYVTEKFKEVHEKTWDAVHGAGRFQIYKEKFRTPQRWNKAIQHLRDSGDLLGAPADIGRLIIEVQRDVGQECKEDIKTFLWGMYGKELLRNTTRGLPEWYKEQLALGEVNV